MTKYEKINKIISQLDDKLFNRLIDNDVNGLLGDKNARRRFLRALKKANITEEEWWFWCEN